jgi:hypothetical protein
VSVNEVPPPLRTPGDIIMSPLMPLLHSVAVTLSEVRLPVPVLLEVIDALVNVTAPKLASAASEQVALHTPGLSTITSALSANGAGAGLAITVENVQSAVVSITFSVHCPPDKRTEALIELPGATW